MRKFVESFDNTKGVQTNLNLLHFYKHSIKNGSGKPRIQGRCSRCTWLAPLVKHDLISALVLISECWDQAPCLAQWSLRSLMRLSLPLPLPLPLALSLSFSPTTVCSALPSPSEKCIIPSMIFMFRYSDRISHCAVLSSTPTFKPSICEAEVLFLPYYA